MKISICEAILLLKVTFLKQFLNYCIPTIVVVPAIEKSDKTQWWQANVYLVIVEHT